MSSAVLVLSLLVALDPVRIGITVLLISRPRPMLNLFTFWLGGMAAGIATALVVLYFLRDFTISLIREVDSAGQQPDRCGHAGCDWCARGADCGAPLGTPVRARAGDRR